MSLSAITPDRIYEVRLDEPAPFSYVVETKRDVPGSQVEEVARELTEKDAVAHAAQWSDIEPAYVPSAYPVKVFDVTGEWPVRVPFQL
ncbi:MULTISPECIES: hypothetical protein [unclassified Streptomyces]|uniref:hypothetical protein n=1 Tax=unclassified Streptomyces TaxID=2593676 RepID=UPI00081E5992|nr:MULTISPECIES: hypothetical protein [unclassified Streptomyces]MYZ40620.1 hypothetical protein [Streptomyces sp. SID4917]SCG08157.1 hypothetical protein GA0115259_1124415 [Streptomyces sp. MnatMP-M17]